MMLHSARFCKLIQLGFVAWKDTGMRDEIARCAAKIAKADDDRNGERATGDLRVRGRRNDRLHRWRFPSGLRLRQFRDRTRDTKEGNEHKQKQGDVRHGETSD
jgi:hypothetical protein